ncbi:hypothetical protein H6501_01255 [Candidatus Woesearchaeota archaeon]|nr:hypothetical protein [Candidatus Woesearchaeota archaeon]USN44731.1 MAG: hypothetical protein H6500_02720 [Candidatus Woesearchaeota archaeon]
MDIHFFEEFPSRENLEKTKLLTFPSTLYIAAKSVAEFRALEKEVSQINPKIKLAYWPLLTKSYWISPFSYTDELQTLYTDLCKNKGKQKLTILLDLELPTLRPKLFFTNFFSFRKNKKLIRTFFEDSEKLNIEILTAEFPVSNKVLQSILQNLGISYSLEKYSHKRIIMFYSSMIKYPLILSTIKRHITSQAPKLKDSLQVGLGTIAMGIKGNEPILKPDKLEQDLLFCQENKIGTVVLFRLGGLDEEYLKVLRKFVPENKKT